MTTLTPAAAADRTGVSIDTLRYYEREGLIGPVRRSTGGRREYTEEDVFWIGLVTCFREAASASRTCGVRRHPARRALSAGPGRLPSRAPYRPGTAGGGTVPGHGGPRRQDRLLQLSAGAPHSARALPIALDGSDPWPGK